MAANHNNATEKVKGKFQKLKGRVEEYISDKKKAKKRKHKHLWDILRDETDEFFKIHFPGISPKSGIIEHALLKHAGISVTPEGGYGLCTVKNDEKKLMIGYEHIDHYDGLSEKDFEDVVGSYNARLGEGVLSSYHGGWIARYFISVQDFIDKLLPELKATIEEILENKTLLNTYKLNSITDIKNLSATKTVGDLFTPYRVTTYTDIYEAVILSMFECEVDLQSFKAHFLSGSLSVEERNCIKFLVNISAEQVKSVIHKINKDYGSADEPVAFFGKDKDSHYCDDTEYCSFYITKQLLVSEKFRKEIVNYLDYNEAFVEHFQQQSASYLISFDNIIYNANQLYVSFKLEKSTKTDIYEATIMRAFGYEGSLDKFDATFYNDGRHVRFEVNIEESELEKVMNRINAEFKPLVHDAKAACILRRKVLYILKSVLMSDEFNDKLTEQLSKDLDLIRKFYPSYEGQEIITKPAISAYKTQMYTAAAGVKPAEVEPPKVKSKMKLG